MNDILRNKLLLQAEEAQEQGMTKLAGAIESSVAEEDFSSYAEVEEKIHQDLWKIAAHIMGHYDMESVDAKKLDKVVASWTERIISDLELSLGVDEQVKTAQEAKVPGEY